MHAQCMGEVLSNFDGGISLAALDQSHIGPMEPRPMSQGFLRQALGLPLAPENLREGWEMLSRPMQGRKLLRG